MNHAVKHSGRLPLNPENAPGQAARLAPNFNPKLSTFYFERILAGQQTLRLFTKLQDSRPAALGKKRLYKLKHQLSLRLPGGV
jgi:hypothetical protein